MSRQQVPVVVWVGAVSLSLVLLTSCNIYKPFASPSNDNEYIQEGQRCLIENDFSCALTNYGKISDTDLKNEKLCEAYMTQAGLGLPELLDTISNSDSGSGMLGSLAAALIPWTQDKETAATNAVATCVKLASISDRQKAALLQVLAYLTDCAVRIAKTDLWVATSSASDSCNSTTAGNGDGKVSSSDVAADASSALSSSNHGMCDYDALTCSTDMNSAAAVSGALGSGLGDVLSNINSVPAALKDTASTAILDRQAIITTL